MFDISTLTTAMKNSVVLWVFVNIFNILVAKSTEGTDVSKPTNHSIPVPQTEGNNTEVTTTKQHILRSITIADHTQQHLESFATDRQSQPTEQNGKAWNTTDVTHNVPVTTYNLAPCLQHPDLQQMTIKGINGHMFFQSTSKIYYRKCAITVQVPSAKIVHLLINVCHRVKLDIADYNNVTEERIILVYKECGPNSSFPLVYSLTDTMVITVIGYGWRDMGLSLYFFAIDKSDRPNLELLFVSQSAGYVQTPGWGGSTRYPHYMKSCVTVTPPTSHVIFLTFFGLDLRINDFLSLLPGQCSSRRSNGRQFVSGRQVSGPLVFPDDFCVEGEDSLCFYFSSGNSKYHSQFKLRFSFHSYDLKPKQVPGYKRDRKWNCSVSVWPDLPDHFPCDLVPQCAQSEDEARCSYTSEKCGLNKIEAAGGRCHIYKRQDSVHTWLDADRECRRHGALLVSLETYQKRKDITGILKFAGNPMIWIGLKAARESTGKAYLNPMYSNTWHWESGSVAYYLDLHVSKTKHFCGLLKPTRYFKSYRAEADNCKSSQYVSVLCEFPSSDRHHVTEPVTLPVPKSTTMSRVPLVTCPPVQHVTHEMLACDVESLCRRLDSTGEWHSKHCTMPQGLTHPYFYCGGPGQFVPYSLVCDFREDCTGGADEDFCVYPVCEKTMLNCGQGQCVAFQKQCDGHKDCMTNFDEAHCEIYKARVHSVINPPAVANFDRPGEFTITPLPGNNTECPDTHFQCPDDGYCLPVYLRCNDVNDCPGHEDEVGCAHYRCSGYYRCRGGDRTICMNLNHLCDGWPQCPQHDDELMCDLTCPEPCSCHGLAFTCTHTFNVRSFPQLRYLEARGSGLHQVDVIHNIMLIHLGVQACGWNNLTDFTLPNLHSLDLSDNLLLQVNFSRFTKMHGLQRLNLAGNPISTSLSGIHRKYLLSSLIIFNFSRVQLDTLNMTTLSAAMVNLQVLDLSLTGITSLQGQHLFQNLRVLDLRGCPTTDFTPDIMKSMNKLILVFADNFRLCCSAVLPDIFRGQCMAPSDEISSCDDLLKSSTYRFVLAVFAVLTISGNLGSFVYRLLLSQERVKTGFAIFVLHLCASDLLMGVYLAFIGVADHAFAGVYVWSETAWKNSAVCSVAGFLSFLSSEVSAFLICLITFDRFLVLRFPFSQIRFGTLSAHVACVVIWALGLILATVPLLPVTSHWEFFHQTGLCIPLPVTRADFPGHSYSFSVMIVCNLVLFLVIAVGQSLIYWSVRSNTISERGTETNNKGSERVRSKEAVIARRLLSIAMSDFLCWFPIGLCGLLAAINVIIPGEVNVVLAIFVLPLNSALNPFLYTLNILLEKQQKAQELRLQRFLQSEMKKVAR